MIPEKNIDELPMAIASNLPKDGTYILNLKIPDFAVPSAAEKLKNYGETKRSGNGLFLKATTKDALDLVNLCLKAEKGDPHKHSDLPELINGIEVIGYAMVTGRRPLYVEEYGG